MYIFLKPFVCIGRLSLMLSYISHMQGGGGSNVPKWKEEAGNAHYWFLLFLRFLD